MSKVCLNIHKFKKVITASGNAGLNFEDFIRKDGFPSIKYIAGGGFAYDQEIGWATHQMDEDEYIAFVLKWL